MVIPITSYLFKIIMLATDSEALLGVRYSFVQRGFMPQEIVLERVHPGICKHEGRIVLIDHGSRRHDGVLLFFKKGQENLPDFCGCFGHNGFILYSL